MARIVCGGNVFPINPYHGWAVAATEAILGLEKFRGGEPPDKEFLQRGLDLCLMLQAGYLAYTAAIFTHDGYEVFQPVNRAEIPNLEYKILSTTDALREILKEGKILSHGLTEELQEFLLDLAQVLNKASEEWKEAKDR